MPPGQRLTGQRLYALDAADDLVIGIGVTVQVSQVLRVQNQRVKSCKHAFKSNKRLV